MEAGAQQYAGMPDPTASRSLPYSPPAASLPPLGSPQPTPTEPQQFCNLRCLAHVNMIHVRFSNGNRSFTRIPEAYRKLNTNCLTRTLTREFCGLMFYLHTGSIPEAYRKLQVKETSRVRGFLYEVIYIFPWISPIHLLAALL